MYYEYLKIFTPSPTFYNPFPNFPLRIIFLQIIKNTVNLPLWRNQKISTCERGGGGNNEKKQKQDLLKGLLPCFSQDTYQLAFVCLLTVIKIVLMRIWIWFTLLKLFFIFPGLLSDSPLSFELNPLIELRLCFCIIQQKKVKIKKFFHRV